MWMQQAGSPKDSPPPPTKRHIRYHAWHPTSTEGNGSSWVTEGDTLLGLCSQPLELHRLNYFLFLNFALGVETSQSCLEEKSKCNHCLPALNSSWQSISPHTYHHAPGSWQEKSWRPWGVGLLGIIMNKPTLEKPGCMERTTPRRKSKAHWHRLSKNIHDLLKHQLSDAANQPLPQPRPHRIGHLSVSAFRRPNALSGVMATWGARGLPALT